MMLLAEATLRFENFVVGASNRLAVSAARAVADQPGATYNPLVVYGPSGLGKTHLVSAIAAEAQLRNPAMRVEVVSAEEFVERFHKAIARGEQEHFALSSRAVDLLILDDLQFLTGQHETQSELLRLFNAMQREQRQLVLTSDRPPTEIADVDARLVSRLTGGLIVDVGVPDYEMRLAILRNAAADRALEVDSGVLETVARLPMNNVRELKGALNRLAAYQTLDGGRVKAADVRAVLGGRWGAPDRVVHVIPTSEAGPDGALPVEYDSFLADLSAEVEQRVEPWRVALGEAAASWRAQGYVVEVLDRALKLSTAPDVAGLLATFGAAVDHLRALEQQTLALDPSLRGNPAFRNPQRVELAQALLDRAVTARAPLPLPDPQFRRTDIERSGSNQLAVSAADAVIEQPGIRYNPLVLQGPPGVGKSQLLHAIGNAIRAQDGGRTVTCVSAPAFVDELIAALQDGTLERFRARYRSADVLLLDDVQFVAGKERTQEELFHLFNALMARGAQVVLTADRPPRAMHGLAERLRSRFEGGLVAPIDPPDRALRQRLVERAIAGAGYAVSAAVIDHIAAIESPDVRELQGRVMRVVAAARARSGPLSLEVVREALGDSAPRPSTLGPATHRPDDSFRDHEKVIWHWPRFADRLAEEWS
jgi:chromosomal replication initiator protein